MEPENLSGAARAETPRLFDSLGELYGRIASAQEAILGSIAERGAPLACPEGCGACCGTFIPDVMPLEAGYLADWLLRERPDLAVRALEWEEDGSSSSCPFHEPSRKGGQCGVYPARPLVCRLFGFSATRDRSGREAFSLCKEMPSRRGRRSWSGEDIEREFGARLPVMTDFTAEAVALAPAESGDRRLLTKALPTAIRRLSLRIYLSKLESSDDPDGGEPPRPAPRAA